MTTESSIRSVGAVEHAQTLIIDENLSFHRKSDKGRLESSRQSGILKKSRSFGGETNPLLSRSHRSVSIPNILEYGASSESGLSINTIRFQVVIWYVGKLDVVEGRVPVTFRLTIFWNDQSPEDDDYDDTNDLDTASSRSQLTWSMHGRQHAVQREMKDLPIKTVDVPPVSILNVSTFDTIGAAEVSVLREDTKLMRWTCMYRTTLIQDDLTVENFPHDQHEITLKLAVLANRNPGRLWDRNIWKLALATDQDSQGSTRIPYGLIVDQVKIPAFTYNKELGLSFDIAPLEHGPAGALRQEGTDEYLKVSFTVLRDSGYYDKNIMPLLGFLNLVAASILCLKPEDFFQRGLLTLQIAFVEIGIRMTTDSHLPSVAYQIKMQRILNEYFYGLLTLALESMVVYELYMDFGWSSGATTVIDWIAAILSLLHNGYNLVMYYWDSQKAKKMLLKYEE